MYISLDWLKEFTSIPKGITPERLANDLTLKTAEVESVSQGGKSLEGVVVGELLEIKKHPNADKLNLAKVDIGKKQPLSLIFGEMVEMKVGYRVPVAVAPTVLPSGMVIEKRELRGQPSEGMLCLDQELGFKEEGVSIQFFPKTIKPGTPISEALGLSDAVLEFDNKSLTHRPDLWGIYGIAREVSAIYKTPFKELKPNPKLPAKGGQIAVDIHNYTLCPRYCGVIIKNVKVQPSPEWMQKRLKAVGHQTYNNIVDVTNYVSSELGQPLHAFDRNLIKKGIVVRTADKGEKIKTIDGETQTLTEEMLVIADHKTPVAIAGVMGGFESGINDSTTEIIIESANFNGANIRRTSTALGLRTEAVQRFEKQLDPNLALTAMLRAIELVLEVSPGASVSGPITDNHKFDKKPLVIDLSVERVNSKIGVKITKTEIKDILTRLQFKTAEKPAAKTASTAAKTAGTAAKTAGTAAKTAGTAAASAVLKITVPSFRAQKDITTEDDVIEEIARIYGYDKIPPALPSLPTRLPMENPERTTKHALKKVLAFGLGFNEIQTYSFYSKEDLENCGLDETLHVQVENYLSEDQTHMRVSLLPNMLKKIHLNSKYFDAFKLFEIGRTYRESGGYFPLEEKQILGAVAVADKSADKSAGTAADKDSVFFEAKGAAIEILRQLMLPPCRLVKGTGLPALPYAHPAASATIMTFKGETLGHIYLLHPQVAKLYGLEKIRTAFFELNFSLIMKLGKVAAKFSELPKFPSIIIDISVVVDETTEIAALKDAITKADKTLIQDVVLFDLYKGENIGKGRKSAAFKVTLQAGDRTLTDNEMKEVQEKIFKNLQKLGGTIRGL